MRKKVTKAEKPRARKATGAIKDLTPKADPQGGFQNVAASIRGGTDILPMESLSLNYSKVEISYRPK